MTNFTGKNRSDEASEQQAERLAQIYNQAEKLYGLTAKTLLTTEALTDLDGQHFLQVRDPDGNWAIRVESLQIGSLTVVPYVKHGPRGWYLPSAKRGGAPGDDGAERKAEAGSAEGSVADPHLSVG